MDNIYKIGEAAVDNVYVNRCKILLATAIAGYAGSVVLALTEGPKAKKALEEYREKCEAEGIEPNKLKEIGVQISKLLPVIFCFAGSTVCAITCYKEQVKIIGNYAALASTLATEKRNLLEAIKEKFGEEKAEEVQEIAAKKCAETYVYDPESMPIEGEYEEGMVVCHEIPTGRVFWAFRDEVVDAAAKLYMAVGREYQVYHNMFYSDLDLKDTIIGDIITYDDSLYPEFQISKTYIDPITGLESIDIDFDFNVARRY